MNLSLYGHQGQWLIVDCGVTFGEEEHQPGVDVIMADPSFIVERRDRLLGLVATHAHEDHIGAIPYLWPQLQCPVWATPFTASVLRAKLGEAGLADRVAITTVPMSGRFPIGPFDLELITLTHSIPEPNAVVIRTAAGTVLHTGDWKLDPEPLVGSPTDEARLREVGDEGVLAIVCDSTNALRPGTSGSEGELRQSLTELIGRYDGRVAIACFASNVARLSTIAHAARAHDRDVALVGRSLWRIEKAARDNGYLADVPRFLSEQEAGYVPRDKIALICTGSQGEPRAALARIAEDEHPEVTLSRGDRVIFSARPIPGNEKAIARVINGLVTQGVEVITDRSHLVHVSGHPRRDELRDLIGWVRPQMLIPAHGEALHLAEHAELARGAGVPKVLVCRNGDMVRLAPNGPEIIDEVPSGRLYKDGALLVNAEARTIATRRRLSFAGVVSVALALDQRGALVADPEVELIGLPETDAGGAAMTEIAFDAVEKAFDTLPKPRRRDPNAVAEAVRRAVRSAIVERWNKKPICHVHVLMVDMS